MNNVDVILLLGIVILIPFIVRYMADEKKAKREHEILTRRYNDLKRDQNLKTDT